MLKLLVFSSVLSDSRKRWQVVFNYQSWFYCHCLLLKYQSRILNLNLLLLISVTSPSFGLLLLGISSCFAGFCSRSCIFPLSNDKRILMLQKIFKNE